MADPAGGLCTIDEVCKYLGIKASDDDHVVRRLILGVSAAAETYCSRRFAVQSYTDEFELRSGGAVYLRNGPVVSITGVTANGQTLAADRYTRNGQLLSPRSCGFGPLVVTYTAGFAAIPEDVKIAVMDTVALRYRDRDNVNKSSQSAGDATTTFVKGGWTAASKDLLKPYIWVPV